MSESNDPEYKERLKAKYQIVNTLPTKATPDNTQQNKIQPKNGGSTGQKLGKFWIKSLSTKKRKKAGDRRFSYSCRSL